MKYLWKWEKLKVCWIQDSKIKRPFADIISILCLTPAIPSQIKEAFWRIFKPLTGQCTGMLIWHLLFFRYKLIRRRVIWLIGQWISVKFKPELRPLLYQVILSLMQDPDLVVSEAYRMSRFLKSTVQPKH